MTKLEVHSEVSRRYPLELVARIVRHAMPKGITGATIQLRPQVGSFRVLGMDKETGRLSFAMLAFDWSGVAYVNERRVLLRVPIRRARAYVRPYQFAGSPGSAGYQGHRVFSGEEALVYIVAHELRHLWQKRFPRARRVYGGRGRYSERDADCYALQVVRSWRRLERKQSNPGLILTSAGKLLGGFQASTRGSRLKPRTPDPIVPRRTIRPDP